VRVCGLPAWQALGTWSWWRSCRPVKACGVQSGRAEIVQACAGLRVVGSRAEIVQAYGVEIMPVWIPSLAGLGGVARQS
jgi:hypothetical protein